MKVESIQNDKYEVNNNNTMSAQDLKDYLNGASFDATVQSHLNDFLAQTNASLASLNKQAMAQPEGPLKTALNGAINALSEKKDIVADMFKDVITYSVYGMWQLAKTNMNNVESTQTCQNHIMTLDEMVETQAEAASNAFTAANTGILSVDIATINQKIAAGNGNGDESEQVNAATSQFNLDNTKMSTVGTFFSGINNMVNNSVSSISQNISVDLSNLSQTTKYWDTIASSMQAQ